MSREGSDLRALILEDSVDDAELLARHLSKAGYRLDWRRAETAAGLREALAEGPWDVVFSDYSMPGFDAPDALAIVKSEHLDAPFIIVSGSVGEGAAVEAMRAGAHDFFLKGNLTRLAAAVERERRDARVRQERRQAIEQLQESQERLREAVRARDEFLSIASHELKTPLTSLTLQVESARQQLAKGDKSDDAVSAANDKLDTKLTAVLRQVSRLATLINNLLDVTRITSGHMVLARETFDLRDAVEAVIAGSQALLTRSGSVLRWNPEAPVRGSWDRIRIESMLSNLVSNAIKYGQGKPITLEVDVQDDRARLIIADAGIGIAAQEQERIFHRFERAVPQQHFGGLGLGLWVAREIIEAHHGTIAVVSAPDAGSTFTVLLPLSPPLQQEKDDSG